MTSIRTKFLVIINIDNILKEKKAYPRKKEHHHIIDIIPAIQNQDQNQSTNHITDHIIHLGIVNHTTVQLIVLFIVQKKIIKGIQKLIIN